MTTDLEWWLELAPTLRWRFARTMPDAPHSYVVRGQALGVDEFDRAVRVIRRHGEPGKFYRATRIYLTDPATATKWWTMGSPLEETIIINQATTDRTYGDEVAPHTRPPAHAHTHTADIYDHLAPIYDRRYDTATCHLENDEVRRMLIRHFGAYAPSTLDVGCGTGLLLDLGITSPAIYTGVDPSQGMLNELVRKYPQIRDGHLIADTMEDALETLADRRYDLVVSLFGAPSYISPDTVKALPTLCTGLTVLMHYREGYLPDYYTGGDRPDPDYVDASREAAQTIEGAVSTEFGNFVMTVIKQ